MAKVDKNSIPPLADAPPAGIAPARRRQAPQAEPQSAEVQTKAPQAPPAVAPAPERTITQLNPIRLKGAEYERITWVVTAHEHTEPSDLLRPDYWAHVAAKLGPWHRIEARANDGSWYGEYLVLEAGRSWARVKMLHIWPLTTTDVALSQAAQMTPFEVMFRGPHNLWSVIRKSDKAVMHEGEQTEGGAIDWMNDRLKAEAR